MSFEDSTFSVVWGSGQDWQLAEKIWVSGKRFSNAIDAAAYLVAIQCGKFYVEEFIDFFVDTLKPVSELAFDKCFGEKTLSSPIFSRFLSCCEKIRQTEIVEQFEEVFFKFLDSLSFWSEDLSLEALFDKIDANVADPQLLMPFIVLF